MKHTEFDYRPVSPGWYVADPVMDENGEIEEILLLPAMAMVEIRFADRADDWGMATQTLGERSSLDGIDLDLSNIARNYTVYLPHLAHLPGVLEMDPKTGLVQPHRPNWVPDHVVWPPRAS